MYKTRQTIIINEEINEIFATHKQLIISNNLFKWLKLPKKSQSKSFKIRKCLNQVCFKEFCWYFVFLILTSKTQ